jgi:hypothetical protein
MKISEIPYVRNMVSRGSKKRKSNLLGCCGSFFGDEPPSTKSLIFASPLLGTTTSESLKSKPGGPSASCGFDCHHNFAVL